MNQPQCSEELATIYRQLMQKTHSKQLWTKKLMPKVLKAYRKIQDDTTRTAGLERSMQLCIAARVMLKRNKDTDAGLVNGSTGTVRDFIFKRSR